VTFLDWKKMQNVSARFGSMLWVIPLVSSIIVWEFVARRSFFPTGRVPAFTVVLATMYECLMTSGFILRVLRSFLNLSIGILSALFLALPLALVAGLRKRVDLTLTPIIMLIGALPDLALLPLVVMWFGPGNAAAIMMATICAFFPVYFTVREGAKGIPGDYFHVATMFKAGRLSTTCKVILPSIFPNMVTGLRLSFDFVWEVILAIEIIASVTGIGTFIESSVAAGTIEYAFAGILSVGLIALSVDRLLFRTLESRIARWRE
jgi:NitT/TauT family transport system permease protein/taurine transport system permease protein/sulfonate transport system permease protein